MCTGIEALSTVSGMKEKGFVALDLGQLMAETFDLEIWMRERQRRSE